MQKKRKKYENKFIAPVRYFLRNQVPKENEIIPNDGVIYEVQSTCDTDNMYPAIAQGYNKAIIDTNCENKDGK